MVRNPETREPELDANGKVKTFTGWRDPNYQPPPGATPVPACWSATPKPTAGASAGASAAPSAGASAAPSAAPGGTVLNEVAQNVQFQTTALEAPAGQAFQIAFDNQDAGIPHNIQISDAGGTLVFEGETINGVAQTTYNVPALAAGVYKFVCKWHPNMVGELTVK